MALPPNLRSFRVGSSTALHTLEFYLDYVCPFSKKQYLGIVEHLLPHISGSLEGQLAIIFRPQIQPWHPTSTLAHESAIALARLTTPDPKPFYIYSYALFSSQNDFFDSATVNETPAETRARLGALVEASLKTGGTEQKLFGGVKDIYKISKKDILDLTSTGEGNNGNAIVADVKYAIKVGRQNSIHVSPTVLLDGVVDPSISSSFGGAEWKNYIKEKIGVEL